MAPSAFARALLCALSYRWRLSALAFLVSLAAAPCAASEIVVRNDSAPPTLDTVLDLPAGSRIGAWLTSPVQGTIVGIQILWGSPNGGAPPSQEAAIRISEFDYPNGPLGPGATLATIADPVFLDGQLNEFRFLDPTSNSQPLAVPIAAGESFFVDLELGNSAREQNAPGILMDLDGETSPYSNLGLVSPVPNWFNILIAVQNAGDFAIRAIIQPVPEPSSVILLGVGAIGMIWASRRGLLSARRGVSALALSLALVATSAGASEIIVKNDSMPPVGTPLPGAQQGMRIGIWLDAPVDGTIVGVQILWGSESGGAAPSQQVALRISPYEPATSMSGTPWATIDSPLLLDSVTNEFRYLDPGTNLLPLAIPVSAGDSFLVDLEFNQQQAGDPSILMDTDGEIAFERNLIKYLSPGWGYLAIGVTNTGDLGIRAIIQPVPEPSSMFLLGVGAIGVVITARRFRKGTSST